MVLHGNGHLIVGNHWFQGDNVTDGPRAAGLVFTEPNVKSVVTGNYIDNCFIEWTNEHDATPDFSSEYSFGGLSLTGNIFTVNDAASWFSWIVVKPFGTGHFLHGVSVTGNVFKSLNGTTDRVEKVDAAIAPLAYGSVRNVVFDGNTFNGVDQVTQNPVTLDFDQATEATTWSIDVGPWLPFGGRAREAVSVTAEGPVSTAGTTPIFAMPYVTLRGRTIEDRDPADLARTGQGSRPCHRPRRPPGLTQIKDRRRASCFPFGETEGEADVQQHPRSDRPIA